MEGGDGYYINSNGNLVVEGDMDTVEQRLRPFYLSKIQQYYKNSSSEPANFLSNLNPLDAVVERQRSSALKEWNATIKKIAPSVVSVSTFGGVSRLVDCSGLVVDRDESTGEATILTSAKLVKFPRSDDRPYYYVAVRLQNGDILLAEEDYVDFYHNILVLKIHTHVELKAICLEDSHPSDGMEVIALGRDFFGTFAESEGLLYLEYPYFGCQELVSTTCEISEVSEGGPLISKSGSIVGVSFYDSYSYAHPLPSSIIKQCLDLWSCGRCVVQPWFGLTVIDTSRLSNDGRQRLSSSNDERQSFNFKSDLENAVVVKEVFEGSPASKAGVCAGDIVYSFNALVPSTASEYSSAMCQLSKVLSEKYAREPRVSKVMLQIYGRGSGVFVDVWGEILDVDDITFYSCWPAVDSQQFLSLRFGSQTDHSLGMILRPDPPSWFLESYEAEGHLSLISEDPPATVLTVASAPRRSQRIKGKNIIQ